MSDVQLDIISPDQAVLREEKGTPVRLGEMKAEHRKSVLMQAGEHRYSTFGGQVVKKKEDGESQFAWPGDKFDECLVVCQASHSSFVSQFSCAYFCLCTRYRSSRWMVSSAALPVKLVTGWLHCALVSFPCWLLNGYVVSSLFRSIDNLLKCLFLLLSFRSGLCGLLANVMCLAKLRKLTS